MFAAGLAPKLKLGLFAAAPKLKPPFWGADCEGRLPKVPAALFGASAVVLLGPKAKRLLAGSPALPLAKLKTGAFDRGAGCTFSGPNANPGDDGLVGAKAKDFAGADVKLNIILLGDEDDLNASKDGKAFAAGLVSVFGLSAFGAEKLNCGTAGFAALRDTDGVGALVAVVDETPTEGALSTCLTTLSVVPNINGFVAVVDVDVTTPKLKVELVGLDVTLGVPKANVVDEELITAAVGVTVVEPSAGIPKLNPLFATEMVLANAFEDTAAVVTVVEPTAGIPKLNPLRAATDL